MHAVRVRVRVRDCTHARMRACTGLYLCLCLCCVAVTDVDRSVREIYRVLKPGGTFLFWEHVLSEDDSAIAALQVRLW